MTQIECECNGEHRAPPLPLASPGGASCAVCVCGCLDHPLAGPSCPPPVDVSLDCPVVHLCVASFAAHLSGAGLLLWLPSEGSQLQGRGEMPHWPCSRSRASGPSRKGPRGPLL